MTFIEFARPGFFFGKAKRFKFTERDAACYLAALVDGEGTVYVGTGKSSKRCVQVCNTEWDIIEAMLECCNILGIRYTITYQKREAPRNDAWTVMIAGFAPMKRFYDLVPIKSARKRLKLARALARYSQIPHYRHGWTRRSPEEVEERVATFREQAFDAERARAAAKLDALMEAR